MQLDKKTIRTLLLMAAGCIVLYWGLQNLDVVGGFAGRVWNLLLPFVVGASIAFILNVPMRAIERALPQKLGRARRAASLTLTILAVVGVLALVLLLIIPQLGRTFSAIAARMPAFLIESENWLNGVIAAYPQVGEWLNGEFFTDWESATAEFLEWLKNDGFVLVGNVAGAATNVVMQFVNFFIGCVFAFYLLVQKETLARQAKMLLYAWGSEKWARRVLDVAGLTNRTFSKFLSGQCLEAFILGCLFAVGMLIFRMPYVTLVSVLVGVTALIPLFGAFIGCIVGALLILVQDPMQAVWFVVLFLCIQQIEGNLIYPKVVGNSVGLPGIWVLMAVTLGGATMGVMGMLVMIPACSVAYSLLRTATRRKLREKGVERKKYLPSPQDEAPR